MLVVQSVSPDSAASKAGLEPGDVIIAFGGKPVTSRDELVRMVVNTRPGTTVPVRIVRDRQERTINITVDELDLEAETTRASGGRDTADPRSGDEQRLRHHAAERDAGDCATAAPRESARRRDHRRRARQPGSARRNAAGDVIVRVGRQPVESALRLSGNWLASLGRHRLPACGLAVARKRS